jgi:hypothetical protein
MAGDWIKMRASLLTNPKLTAICKKVESSKAVGKKLTTGFGGALREIVTRDVTRDVTLASLFRVWCAANEHTSDGVWYGIDLDDLDHVAGLPGFGSMMEAVGWAMFDAENQTVTFPNFLEYNAPAKEGRGSSAAERQRRYREKQRTKGAESDVTRDVTVTRNSDGQSDIEKRREEKINTLSHKPKSKHLESDEFKEVWEAWKEKQRSNLGYAMDEMTIEAQLYKIERFETDEAIEIVRFSTSRTKCNNLITNGDHKGRPDRKGSKQEIGM